MARACPSRDLRERTESPEQGKPWTFRSCVYPACSVCLEARESNYLVMLTFSSEVLVHTTHKSHSEGVRGRQCMYAIALDIYILTRGLTGNNMSIELYF